MIYPVIYVAAIVAANLLVACFGPWWSIANSFVLIGLDLSLRDFLHERWSGKFLWPRMIFLIATAGAVSFLLNPAAGSIAVASVVAFCVAGLADAMVFHRMSGHGYLGRSNASNAAGAVVDSLIFTWVAFGAVLPGVAAMQVSAKILGGAIWSLIIWRARHGRTEKQHDD